jgi:hypothetical protein
MSAIPEGTTFYLKFGYKIKVNSIVFPCFLKKVSLGNEFINRSVDQNILGLADGNPSSTLTRNK